MPEKREETQHKPTDEEILKMLERMREIDSSLKKEIEQIYAKSGISYQQIERYLEDERNFPPGVWRKLKSEAYQIENRLVAFLGDSIRKKRVVAEGKKGSKERKGKTLGARKGWLPMR